jgi:ribonuclease-3 family protein
VIRVAEENFLYFNISALAFVGDAVYELHVRLNIARAGVIHGDHLHRISTQYVRASAQAKAIKAMLPCLPEEEQQLVRRARNKKIGVKPKNADAMDYKWATAFEALLGYYSMSGQTDRLDAAAAEAMRIISTQ